MTRRAEIGSHKQPYRGPTPFPPPLTDHDITHTYGSYVHDEEWEDDEAPREGEAHIGGLVDWVKLLEGDRTEQEWLVEPFLALGRSHALYAPAKAGKSLLALEIACAVAAGRPVLHQPAGRPRTVMYVDMEMTEDDLAERVTDLGYGALELAMLHYFLLPTLPPLDTPEGGALIVIEAQRIKAELVVIDTVARSISGDENSSDTVIALARHTFQPLKRAGITSLRVDHAGKDLTKGQRGTSAKNDDVDVVWQLTVADQNAVTLRATHRRLGWVPEVVNLTRTEEPLSHKIADHVWPAGTAEAARKLDELKAPLTVTTAAARDLLKCARNVAVAAVKYRKMEWMSGTQASSTGTYPQGQYQAPVPDTDTRADQGVPGRVPESTGGSGKRVPEYPPKGVPVLSPTEKPRLRLSPEAQERWDTEEF